LPTLLQRSPIVTGAITGIVAVTNYLNVQQRIEDVRQESELIAAPVGAGIWTLVVGAVLAIVGGVLVRMCLSPDNRQASGRELGAASGPHVQPPRQAPLGSLQAAPASLAL
jgi:hypothetical protein